MRQSIIYFFSTFFFFFFFTNGASNLVQETCKRCGQKDPNLSYGFCVTSLQAATNSEPLDLHKLGLISVRLVKKNVTSTKQRIKSILKTQSLETFTKSCLSDCLELYSDAVPTIKKAEKEYRASRYDDANIEVSSVMDASHNCEDEFKEKKGVVSPLTKENNDTFQLTAIALSIINMQLASLNYSYSS